MLIAMGVGMWFGSSVPLHPGSNRIKTDDLSATLLTPAKALNPFSLIDHRRQSFTLDSLKDRWTWMFFGYTHCPDVCPTTMRILDTVTNRIAPEIDTQVVFVSVDPERDTVEQLSLYVPYFNKSFVGVTGNIEELDRVTNELGILHVRVETDGGSGYLVDHSASVLLVNPSAQLQALFSPPHQAAEMAADFQKILNRIRL